MPKPTTHQGDLAKLPSALLSLIEHKQWCVWRWTQKPDGSWQKPPYVATQPDRHASTSDANTWTDYATALAAVQAGHADGLSYVLTADDSFAAIDLDHCRDQLGGMDIWAQLFLERGRNTYSEVTPSGTGCRIWGLAEGEPLNRKFSLEIDGKPIAAELFRRTNKALTITGYTLDPAIRRLANIDKVLGWATVWGERRKAAVAAVAAAPSPGGNGFNGSACPYTVEQIEAMVRDGAPPGSDRSAIFHTIVGHLSGCGWDAERIFTHVAQFPAGIGAKYIAEGRLAAEIARSLGKFQANEHPLSGNGGWANEWDAKAPVQPEPVEDEPEIEEEQSSEPAQDPELDDDLEEELEDDQEEDLPPTDPELPPLHAHGDPDPRPLKAWLIKHLIPAIGHGLLSGQWGTGKTFAFFDLAAALSTGQPWLDHRVTRQCGVLLIAAEGGDEVRLRLDAVIREKCGGLQRAPFRWYETAPLLLHKGAVEKLIAMARQAEVSLRKEFGLPLGLIVIDTIAACAGYSRAGDEYDNAVGQAVMNVLKAVAQELGCFVLGIDHFGKSLEAGTRGASSKESSGDVVLACLGDKQLNGSVTNTRLAVRKHRGGRQGQEYPFTLRMVEAPEKDEDGDPVTTMVMDWLPASVPGAAAPPPDPWAEARRQDQRTAVLRLKRVLMAILAELGVDLPTGPDGPMVRMVDQELVRKAFYDSTSAEGTPKQKRQFRYAQFKRALDWAEQERLIAVGEIGDTTYLWLIRPNPEDAEEE